MNKHKAKLEGLKRRQRRVRGKISGTAERPRLRVTRTNANIYAQIIDDSKGSSLTLVSASTLEAEFKGTHTSNKEAAEKVGQLVGKRAIEAGITKVAFDRGGRIYHGRVKALADGARAAGLEFEERVVYINRVSKTVKGGRRMSLVALVVVGDGKGNVGVGMGKSAEVPMAISKASLDAKKNMFHVPVTEEGTIPHEVIGHFGAGRIIIKPAVEGTGVIAGGAVRPLFELAGIKNVLSKSLGTDNGLNIIKAAVEGLKELSSPEDVAARRGLTVSEMFVGKEN